MGLLQWLFGKASPDDEKARKFRELEQTWGGDELGDGMVVFLKAQWLTHRANHYGMRGDLSNAVAGFQEAIATCPDYIHAYVALSEAYRLSGQLQNALEVLESAPRHMNLFGEQVNCEYDVLNQLVTVHLARDDRERA